MRRNGLLSSEQSLYIFQFHRRSVETRIAHSKRAGLRHWLMRVIPLHRGSYTSRLKTGLVNECIQQTNIEINC